MKKAKQFLLNMILLTFTAFLMRTIGVAFNVYLSNRIGATEIGLYQLVMSVYMFGITLATSGIKLATTRLVAEELTNHTSAKRVVNTCLVYALCFGSFSFFTIFSNAQYIAQNWLFDLHTAPSLRILACSLPFIAITSVWSGYFTAVRRVMKSASVQIAEQLVRIFLTVIGLTFLMPKGLHYACVAIVIGATLAEIFSFVVLLFLYLHDVHHHPRGTKKPLRIGARMFHIALPVAFSSYIRSALSTLEHLLIPYGLKKSGISSEIALATYGIIHGMVLPIVLFPSALLYALADLLVPELAQCQMRHDTKRISYILSRVFQLGFLFSIGVAGVLFCYAQELGILIYNNTAVSYFIKIFSPLVLIMYMDAIVDGMLKGLGEQVSAMNYNIIDSLLSTVLIYLLLPKFAIGGYLATVVIAELVNFTLSIRRLLKVTNFTINLYGYVVKPTLSIFLSIALTHLLFHFYPLPFSSPVYTICAEITGVVFVYILYLYLFSSITKKDVMWFFSIFK